MKNFKVAIVDADSILYTVCLAAQEMHYRVEEKVFTDKEEAEEHGEPVKEYVELRTLDETLEHYRELIGKIGENTGADQIDCYTGSSDGNFRKEIATIKPYKGNRKGPDPLQLEALKEELISTGELIRADSMLEADDQVIIEFRKHKANLGEGNVVLCVIDKDAKQEPGWHYNFNTEDLVHIKPIDSLRYFYTQLLIGDSIDNILGLYKVGARSTLVKHLYTLEDEVEMFKMIYSEYHKRFGNYASTFIAETFVLLYMLRSPDEMEGVYKVMQLLEVIGEASD